MLNALFCKKWSRYSYSGNYTQYYYIWWPFPFNISAWKVIEWVFSSFSFYLKNRNTLILRSTNQQLSFCKLIVSLFQRLVSFKNLITKWFLPVNVDKIRKSQQRRGIGPKSNSRQSRCLKAKSQRSNGYSRNYYSCQRSKHISSYRKKDVWYGVNIKWEPTKCANCRGNLHCGTSI